MPNPFLAGLTGGATTNHMINSGCNTDMKLIQFLDSGNLKIHICSFPANYYSISVSNSCPYVNTKFLIQYSKFFHNFIIVLFLSINSFFYLVFEQSILFLFHNPIVSDNLHLIILSTFNLICYIWYVTPITYKNIYL